MFSQFIAVVVFVCVSEVTQETLHASLVFGGREAIEYFVPAVEVLYSSVV